MSVGYGRSTTTTADALWTMNANHQQPFRRGERNADDDRSAGEKSRDA